MKLIISFAICLITAGIVTAQKGEQAPVQVGQPIGQFSLSDIRYYPKSSVTQDDFKGKWLILDFWNASCMVCIKAMPKMDSLQARLRNNTKVMLVGYTGSQYHQGTGENDEKKIKEVYERVKSHAKFNLPSAFDSTLFHRFNIAPCPYIIIVDPEGIVRGVTSRLDYGQMDSILKGIPVELRKAYTSKESKQIRAERLKAEGKDKKIGRRHMSPPY